MGNDSIDKKQGVLGKYRHAFAEKKSCDYIDVNVYTEKMFGGRKKNYERLKRHHRRGLNGNTGFRDQT